MMYDPMEMVASFHDKFHPDMEDRIFEPLSPELVSKRINLIIEESHEVEEALTDLATDFGDDGKWEHAAKELADLLYVVYGTADELGIPIERVFEAVHKSNMSKVWSDGTVHYREDGKVLKPPTYTVPDLTGALYGGEG